MTIVKLKGFQFTFPKEIRENAHIQKDQKFIVETIPDNVVQIKPVIENDADDRLLQFLNHPEDMGKVLYRDRNDIYDDIN